MSDTERSDIWPEFAWRLYLTPATRRINVEEGGWVPYGYGIAYYLPGRDIAVAMPVPLNSIVGAIRALRHWLMFPPWRAVEFAALNASYFAQRRQEEMDSAQQFGYRLGLREGKDDGYREGMAAAEKRLNDFTDNYLKNLRAGSDQRTP